VPVAALSRTIAAQFRAAWEATAPAVVANIPVNVWRRGWVSFLKHYGPGTDAVLASLSRYVFRTAITHARALEMDETHVVFRWKDRRTNAWRTERLPGVEFLRRFLQHVLPPGFHKVRYDGPWHPSKREESARAWVLLLLAPPTDTTGPIVMASLLEALGPVTQGREGTDGVHHDAADADRADAGADLPRCPHCGRCRPRFLGAGPRHGVP
jgi:Putative transposase